VIPKLNPIDCRFLALSHNSADLSQIIQALNGVSRDEDVIYLRKEDVVRLIRQLANDEDAQMHNFHSLADTLEGINR